MSSVGRSGGGGELAIADADAVAVIDPGKHSLLADIPVGSSPAQVTAGAGALWVATPRPPDTVSRIDPRTRAVSQTIAVGNGPAAVAVGAGGVWVVNSLDGTLSWISPATNEVVKTIPTGNSPSGVCVAAGAVWVASPYDRSIVRFDPVSATHDDDPLDDQPTQLACGGGSVWATSQIVRDGHPAEHRRPAEPSSARIGVGRNPSGLAWGDGALWVANTDDGTVSRIDGRSGVQTAVIPLGTTSGPTSVAADGERRLGRQRASGHRGPHRSRSQRRRQTLKTGNHPQGLAVVDGALWVSVRATGAQHRGGTLRVVHTATPTASRRPRPLDPAARLRRMGAPSRLTNDGLVAFRRVGGRAGEHAGARSGGVGAGADRRWPHLRLPAAPRAALLHGRGGARLRRPPRPGARPAREREHRIVLHGDPRRPALPGAAQQGALRPLLRHPGR